MAGFAERVWVVVPGINHAGIAAVCESFASFAAEDPGRPLIICDVGAVTDPDLATLSLLARMQLTARRLGCSIRLRRARPRLAGLILFSGLGAVLPLCSGLTLEPGRQAEQGKEPVHIEEIVEPFDPAV